MRNIIILLLLLITISLTGQPVQVIHVPEDFVYDTCYFEISTDTKIIFDCYQELSENILYFLDDFYLWYNNDSIYVYSLEQGKDLRIKISEAMTDDITTFLMWLNKRKL